MISDRTEPIERLLAVCVYIFLAVFIVLGAYQLQHGDSDIFWALRSGQWIIDSFAVPVTDPFSFTFAGKAWVDFTWGFQVIAFLFYKYAGQWTGLFILQLVITAATFIVAGLNLGLTAQKRAWLVASLLLTLFVASYTRLMIRPHLFSYFFISIYLLLLNIHERRSKARGRLPVALYALVPLQILWVNIHSSAILGIFIVGAYTAGWVLDLFLFRTAPLNTQTSAALKRLVAVSILIPLVSVLNPYGVKLILFPFVHQGGVNTDALRHIGEWTRIPLKELLLNFSLSPVAFTAFRVSFYASVAAMLLNLRRLKVRDVILFTGAFYMAASHVRWVSQFAFFALPIAGANLAAYFDFKRENMSAGYNSRTEPLFKTAGLLLCLFLIILISMRFFSSDASVNRGVGLRAGHFPEGNVQFLERIGYSSNLFNEYNQGGYLVFARQGQKVFIDGRTPTVYSPAFYWSTRLADEPSSWRRLVAEHDLEAALVSSNKPICATLQKSQEWRAVNFDENFVLYLRTGEPNKAFIDKYALQSFDPCEGKTGFVPPDSRDELLSMHAELELFSQRPEAQGLAKVHLLLGQIETELGGEYLESAVAHLLKSSQIIDSPYVRYDYGVALSKLERKAEAIEQFSLALERRPKFKEAVLALSVMYFKNEEYKEALEWLKKYMVIADDTAIHSAYKMLGLAAIELNKYEIAVDALKRAAFGTDDTTVLADIYFKLGNIYFERSEFKEGTKAYARAVLNDPEYVVVLSHLGQSHEKNGLLKRAEFIREFLSSRTEPVESVLE